MHEVAEWNGWAAARFAELRAAFHAERKPIALLVTSGVPQRQITGLYPFDFLDYLPELGRLLRDAEVTQPLFSDEVKLSFSSGTLEVSGFDVSGEELTYLEDPFAVEEMLALFTSTYLAYVTGAKVLAEPPKHRAHRTREEHANTNVDNLLRNLWWSAWLLANWQNLRLVPDAWSETEMASDMRGELIEEVQRVFKRYWQPLLSAQRGVK